MAMMLAFIFLSWLDGLACRFARRLPRHMAVVWMCFAAAAVWMVLTDRSGLVASLGLDRSPLFSSVLVFWMFLTVAGLYRTGWYRR
jgi:hypothetical protein